jgi:hypothetical protein
VQRQLADISLPAPRLLRWPLQIELSDFAEYIAGNRGHSLLGTWRKCHGAPERVTAGDLLVAVGRVGA